MGSLHVFRKTPHKDTFGVEIECYPTYHRYPDSYLGFFYCTMDASLGGDGREFISQPLPFDMLINKIKWLHNTVGGWTVGDDCGLHVHVSRKMWPAKQEEEFSWFLRNCADNRELRKVLFTRWFGRDCTRHWSPWYDEVDKFRAVNLCHANSYEFRMFKGGDLEWTLHTLRVVRRIVRHRGEWTIERMDKLTQRGVKHEVVKAQDRNHEGVGARVVHPAVRLIRATPLAAVAPMRPAPITLAQLRQRRLSGPGTVRINGD